MDVYVFRGKRWGRSHPSVSIPPLSAFLQTNSSFVSCRSQKKRSTTGPSPFPTHSRLLPLFLPSAEIRNCKSKKTAGKAGWDAGEHTFVRIADAAVLRAQKTRSKDRRCFTVLLHPIPPSRRPFAVYKFCNLSGSEFHSSAGIFLLRQLCLHHVFQRARK